jgi:hypothetical protein
MREGVGRSLMLVGLVVTGMALLFGVLGGHRYLTGALGGPIRAELTLLGVGAAIFFLGQFVAGGKR